MKRIWKVVLIVTLVLCVVGIICGAVAYFLGGTVDNLYQNQAAIPVLEMLSPQNILNSISSFFGF